MKVLLSILIILGVIFVSWKTWDYWKKTEAEKMEGQETQGEILPSSRFEGLPEKLRRELQDQQKRGADGLRDFLNKWSHLVKDPRLAAIELDYVVAVSGKDPIEAKRRFAAVKKRITKESKLWPRIEALSKTYD